MTSDIARQLAVSQEYLDDWLRRIRTEEIELSYTDILRMIPSSPLWYPLLQENREANRRLLNHLLAAENVFSLPMDQARKWAFGMRHIMEHLPDNSWQQQNQYRWRIECAWNVWTYGPLTNIKPPPEALILATSAMLETFTNPLTLDFFPFPQHLLDVIFTEALMQKSPYRVDPEAYIGAQKMYTWIYNLWTESHPTLEWPAFEQMIASSQALGVSASEWMECTSQKPSVQLTPMDLSCTF